MLRERISILLVALTVLCGILYGIAANLEAFTVSTAFDNLRGNVSPGSRTVSQGGIAEFRVTPDRSYSIKTVSGCRGALHGETYVTGPVTANCTVTVTFEQRTFSLSGHVRIKEDNYRYIPIEGVRITARNSNNAISVNTNPYGNYVIDLKDGVYELVASKTGYTFTPKSRSVTVSRPTDSSFDFTADPFTVTPVAGQGGNISPAAQQTKDLNSTATFTITPKAEYEIDTVSGCGGSYAGNTFRTGLITANCTVTANFKRTSVTVAAVGGTPGLNDGLVNPSGQVKIRYGSDKIFNIATFSEEYNIKDVMVDGVSVKGTPNYSERSPREATYTFRNATTDHRLEAIFKRTARIDATANTGGTIAPYPDQRVDLMHIDYGSSQSFLIKSYTNYRIKEIQVNNAPVAFTAGSTELRHTVNNITGRNNTIRASFESACTYSINPSQNTISAKAGGSGSVSVSAPTGCAWTAASNASWIKITQGSNGSGNGTVNYSVEAMKAKVSASTGTLTIAGKTFAVTQQ